MSIEPKPLNFWGYLISLTLLILLSYAAFLAYESIDWDVLKRLEASPITIPTPAPVATITPPPTAK